MGWETPYPLGSESEESRAQVREQEMRRRVPGPCHPLDLGLFKEVFKAERGKKTMFRAHKNQVIHSLPLTQEMRLLVCLGRSPLLPPHCETTAHRSHCNGTFPDHEVLPLTGGQSEGRVRAMSF